jgi:hypothetical protein
VDVLDGLLLLLVGDALEKKDVIWRWAGSLAAPANWRFVRGADMSFFFFLFPDGPGTEDQRAGCEYVQLEWTLKARWMFDRQRQGGFQKPGGCGST